MWIVYLQSSDNCLSRLHRLARKNRFPVAAKSFPLGIHFLCFLQDVKMENFT